MRQRVAARRIQDKNVMVRGVRKWWWIAGPLGFVLLASVGVGAMAGDREPLILDAHERSRLPGRFVALSHGYTSYDVIGPADGRVVLLVPGISIPRIVFARTATSLAEAGYRVLTYDLYGRGFSDRPHVRYDAALFNQQIDELLAAMQITGRVTLVGVASGALQSMLYAEFRPTRVERLVLICPDGVNAPAEGFVRMVRSPLVGETAGRAVLNMVGQRRWEERLQNYSSDRRVVEDMITSFRRQLDYKGYWRALASSIASLPISESSDLFRRIDRLGTPTLVVWGTNDVIIPVHLGHEVRRLMPSAKYVEIPAGHLPQYERPDLTNEAILRFLSAPQAGRPRANSNPLAAGWSDSSE
jgi:pimeloyl-ACP methyl ester carboxylesterase